uniref:Uncharacterized protein n=1 Tax=uncultured marine thaumarchaeote SAT1000_44_H06 TaxID=1456411 RepID=A0A075I8U9_9ARCH|nr:hypothetical protein [uncultured marine thaumarchaeote SAT1000_44_H06]
MKNEIGRKLTSLTIMAIMFAGGLTVAAPSLTPGVFADFGETDGMLSVSSVYIQGGAILEIVVNDPAVSATDVSVSNGPVVTMDGTDYITNQGSNGKWYVYAVDDSISTDLDDNSDGMEYGVQCTSGIGVHTGPVNGDIVRGVANIIGSSGPDVWVEAQGTSANAGAGGCLGLNNASGSSDDTSGTTGRSLMSDAVLQDAPSLSRWNGAIHNSSLIDWGQRGHGLNESGYGSWPYILAFEFPSDLLVEYGSSSINVEFGNTDSQTSISLLNQSPADETHLYLTLTDPALNIDPTSADVWTFDLSATHDSADALYFSNNETDNTGGNAAMSVAERSSMGCSANCKLGNSTNIAGIVDGHGEVIMTENAANSGVFESWSGNGTSQLVTVDEIGGDKKVIFTYGGNSVDMIITYNAASLTLDAGDGDWVAGETAYMTLVDPDLNKNPGIAETQEIGDETSMIPTIIVGSPLTLANSAGNNNLEDWDAQNNAGVQVGVTGSSTQTTGMSYTLAINNVSDNSERLRILHSAEATATSCVATTCIGGEGHTVTWINVTTAHTRADIIDLPGTVVLNYDVSAPAALLSSTAVSVYVVDSGENGTNNAAGSILAVSGGNIAAGVVDLDDGTIWVKNTDVSDPNFTTSGGGEAGTVNVGVAFKIEHAIGTFLNTTADYAIAADFCNFDQDNGSNVHNCIYRIEAEETGENTGIFEGSVDYVMLNNSTAAGTISGEHAGNDEEVEDMLSTSSDEVTVVLMNGVSGSDTIRVVYNDTDALQGADKLGAQIDTLTHSGTAGLDADTYEDADMATITIVDADLNQDSGIRDTYENSSRTFQITVTGSDGVAEQHVSTAPQTVIETTNDSGIFVGTFKVPNYKGEDLELVYYDSKDLAGEAVEVYDTATVTSNSGSVSFDRSVYPVPFASADLRTGANAETGQTEAGNVTMTITVLDSDFTSDQLTTSAANAPGTILIKLIEGATTSTCFTAGSAAAADMVNFVGDDGDAVAQELGPLTESAIGSAVYELEFTVDEQQQCRTSATAASIQTITSGDVFQVEYVDTADDAGTTTTVYDSSTFDLRTGNLSVDKDVYVLGSDVVITLTDADLNLDSGSIESYALSLIEWDSDADSSELMNDTDNFTANPSKLQETGSDTGVFQSVVTLPSASLYPGGDTSASAVTIDYGEAVTLTYVDVGLSGENSTEDDVLDVEAYFSISNFGALIELDKAVYNWTDTVYITITSPDHNVNSASEESIGTSGLPIQVTTRSGKMCTSGDKTYFAAEDGPDTGVFTAEVGLQGFDHTMSSDSSTRGAQTTDCGSTSTGGTIKTSAQTDGVSVSYEYNDGSVVVASASITWNIGEGSFDSSVASAGGSAVFTVVDPDENLDSTITDAFTVAIYSDSDSGGFTLTLNETDEDTGVFEGTVFFTADAATSGSNIRVSEGDTVTAEYTDETLPEPYTTSDDLTIAATLTIGTAFPPLERAPAANARVVDAFGSSVAEVSSGQQVQIAADVSNGQSKDQAFAYLVQVQDGNGVTVSLAWITGSLTAGQSMSPALSWTPDASGTYTATVFVWESVDNPTALSPTVSVSIDVV